MGAIMLKKSIVSLVILFMSTFSQASIVEEVDNVVGFFEYNGYEYVLISDLTWSQAVTLSGSNSAGLSLVKIESEEENNAIVNSFGQIGSSVTINGWIGLNDISAEGDYRWLDDSHYSYEAFSPGEPNNGGGNEDAIAIFLTDVNRFGKWNDWTEIRSFHGIFERQLNTSSTLASDVNSPLAISFLSLILMAGSSRSFKDRN